jgi:hypothetical protein
MPKYNHTLEERNNKEELVTCALDTCIFAAGNVMRNYG